MYGMILEAMQDARTQIDTPAKDTFCDWHEVELRAAMEKDAKSVRMENRNLVYRNTGASFSGRTDGTHVACKAAMNEIGRPCTRRELEFALDVQKKTIERYLRALIHSEEVFTDRNDEGQIVYILRAGYDGQGQLNL
jgi:predicted HTH transcriptional regulator